MDPSDAYEPPTQKPVPPLKKPDSSPWVRRIIGWGLSLLVIGILVGMLLPATRRVRPAARRTTCMNNMRQIALAMLNYESAHGHFPPAYIADDRGKPMHSWRVLILPFMEQNQLYQRYSMDEPWNGPNNRQLADEISAIFTCPSHYQPDDHGISTQYCLVTGKGTLFEEDSEPTFDDIKDGSSNTILLVEVNRGDIPWMEPRDLTVEEAIDVFKQAESDQDGHHPGTQNVALADGSTQSLSTSTSRQKLTNFFLVADEFGN